MKWAHRVSLVLGILLLGGLLWKLGPRALLDQLRLLGWIWIPLILMEGLGEAMHAMGWRSCLSREHQGLPWIKVAMIRQAGMAFNYLTPTAHMGGEVIKGVLLGQVGSGAGAASGVIVGKLALALSQLMFVVAGSMIAIWMAALSFHIWLGWAIGTVLFSSGIVCFFLLQRWGKLGGFLRALQQKGVGGAALDRLTSRLTQVDEHLQAFHRDRPGDFIRAMAWHALGFSCGVIQAWIFLLGIGLTDPWKIGVTIWFLGAWFDLVGFLVPAGVGIQEGSRVLIFHGLGRAGIEGLTYGFALRIQKAFWATVGLGCYGFLIQKPKTTGEIA